MSRITYYSIYRPIGGDREQHIIDFPTQEEAQAFVERQSCRAELVIYRIRKEKVA